MMYLLLTLTAQPKLTSQIMPKPRIFLPTLLIYRMMLTIEQLRTLKRPNGVVSLMLVLIRQLLQKRLQAQRLTERLMLFRVVMLRMLRLTVHLQLTLLPKKLILILLDMLKKLIQVLLRLQMLQVVVMQALHRLSKVTIPDLQMPVLQVM